MYGALLLFDDEFIHIVAISFTALILTELVMVALTARKWHLIMILGELASLVIYIASLAIFHEFFGNDESSIHLLFSVLLMSFQNLDSQFIRTTDFLWKVLVITAISCIPLYIVKCIHKKLSPPSYSKLT